MPDEETTTIEITKADRARLNRLRRYPKGRTDRWFTACWIRAKIGGSVPRRSWRSGNPWQRSNGAST